MNWDQIEGKWKEISGSFREKFGQLTNNDVENLGGKKDQMVGTLQQKYGHSKEEAERHLDDWRQSLKEQKEIPTSTSGSSTY